MSEENDDPLPPKKSRTTSILLSIGLLILGVAGGYGGFALLGSSAAAGEGEKAEGEEKPAEGNEAAHGEGAKKGEEHGDGEVVETNKATSSVVNLGVFTVNLRGSGGGRVLRMEVQLDTGENTSLAMSERAPQLRDTVITAVSDYTWAELEGVDGKTRLRDELLERLNGAAAPLIVNRLYFTQFVVQ